MNAKHTTEQLAYSVHSADFPGLFDVFVPNGDLVAHVMGGEERARRIVACVNACVGFSTEFLEGGGIAKSGEMYREQRDALLAALKGVISVADRDTDEFILARSVIAEIESGKVPT